MAVGIMESRPTKGPSEWEISLASWAKGPGKTEQEKCENSENAIKKAIAAHERLSKMDITVFALGSYRGRTNVRQDSDVDICVRLNTTYFNDYPKGKAREDFGFVDGSISYADFKNLVGEALVARFGKTGVTRGKKAFDVHENTNRIDADVVAALEHRRYTGQENWDGSPHFHRGTAFIPDNGGMVKNWPEQNFNNGKKKHEDTGERYKKLVRILKRLRNEMQDAKVPEAMNIPSFLVECLVWNVPNDQFGRAGWLGENPFYTDLKNVITSVYLNTKTDATCTEWGEVNELKYLFKGGQPWTREQANAFILACWQFVGFKNS